MWHIICPEWYQQRTSTLLISSCCYGYRTANRLTWLPSPSLNFAAILFPGDPGVTIAGRRSNVSFFTLISCRGPGRCAACSGARLRCIAVGSAVLRVRFPWPSLGRLLSITIYFIVCIDIWWACSPVSLSPLIPTTVRPHRTFAPPPVLQINIW